MVVGRKWLKYWNDDLDIESIMGERIVKTKTVYNKRTYPTFRYAEVLLYGVLEIQEKGELVLLRIASKGYPLDGVSAADAEKMLKSNRITNNELKELRKAVVGKRLSEIVSEDGH